MKYFSASQQWVLLVIALLLLGSLTFKFYDYPRPVPSGDPAREVVVEVSGEVRQPGIYVYQNPPRLRHAIDRAGGLKEPAQFDTNLSSTILETGTLLIVTRDPPQAPLSLASSDGGRKSTKQDEIKISLRRMSANKLLVFSIPLDLNDVSAEDLCLVPGIGKSLAQEMIAYRERRKGFRSVEELKNVRGIGEKKYQDLSVFFVAR